MPASSSTIVPALGAALSAVLAGCAAGPDAAPSARQQHARSVARAAEYCRSKGLAMRAGASDQPTRPGQAASDFQFRCVKTR